MGYEVINPITIPSNPNGIYGVDFQFNSSGVFKKIPIVVNQIRANLKNLLLTQLGERYYLPEFGCNLLQALFEPNTDELKPFIQQTIFEAVQKWMPYIGVNVEITTASDDPNLTDSIKVVVTGFVDEIALDPIVIFSAEGGISVSDTTNQ